ncbi:GNAT family N-acetyltransferase [Ktedonospora formicarum]|uniref:Putative acetyltransferase, GNAT n=1 Tax=Ktedonospora formicarum TaxID=2778364 RepID=A0A8J3HZV5_9CHLR|nr:GNAT family N-acetyltransferase [Ktedonospora formicarum]GHO42979.1 putative acetyltransferase, GNAT [Ktedonospora formicarum]
MLETQIPQGMKLRPATFDDITAIGMLYVERDKALGIEPVEPLSSREDELRHDFAAPSFDLQIDTRVALNEHGELIGYATTDHQQHVHTWLNMVMRMDYQDSAIEQVLLNWGEVRAREHIALAADGLRVIQRTWVDARYTARQRLLERHGFQLTRRFYRMKIELEEPLTQPIWPSDIHVQTFQPGMERAVFEADEDIFRDHWGFVGDDYDEWAHHALNPQTFDPSLWFLAMDGEQIAGIALCAKETAQEGEYEGWVHSLGVRRAWRRKGLAQALLHEAFNAFYQRGLPDVLLGVDATSLTGATRLYEKVGMHAIKEFLNYEKELRPGVERGTETLVEE